MRGRTASFGMSGEGKAISISAKEWGLIQQPLGQRWLLELPDPAAEVQGPLTIASGPAAGIQVTFANREGKWLLKELKKVRVTGR